MRMPRPTTAARARAPERGEVKARSRCVHCHERNEDAADRADEHARDARPGSVLAQEVADARAVAEADRASFSRTTCRTTRTGRTRFARRSHRADEVVDLLARAHGSDEPRPSARRTSRRVRRLARRRKIANEFARFQRLSSVEHRRDRASTTPTIAPRRPRPARSAPSSVGVRREALATRASSAGGYMQSSSGNATTSARRARDRHCAHARARRRAHVLELDARPCDYLSEPLVVVLVDDDHAQRSISLRLERVEEAAQLVASADRRDDEVERRKLPRHGP